MTHLPRTMSSNRMKTVEVVANRIGCFECSYSLTNLAHGYRGLRFLNEVLVHKLDEMKYWLPRLMVQTSNPFTSAQTHPE